MNKQDIISAVSIEFGLSRELSERTVNIIFNTVASALKKNKVLEIQKFGKFKLSFPKEGEEKFPLIRFAPSKKLSARVNSKFDNLKKVKIKFEPAPVIKNDYALPENEEAKADKTIETEKVKEPKEDPSINYGQRKLISEDLVKLHKEITNEKKDGNDDPSPVTNLWG